MNAPRNCPTCGKKGYCPPPKPRPLRDTLPTAKVKEALDAYLETVQRAYAIDADTERKRLKTIIDELYKAYRTFIVLLMAIPDNNWGEKAIKADLFDAIKRVQTKTGAQCFGKILPKMTVSMSG